MASTGYPNKRYYKVGEVSRIAQLPAYVLRFWESEFKQISPQRTAAGQRLYRLRDVETILEIKRLLYEEKFTIEGARQQLKTRRNQKSHPTPQVTLAEIRKELQSLRDMLD